MRVRVVVLRCILFTQIAQVSLSVIPHGTLGIGIGSGVDVSDASFRLQRDSGGGVEENFQEGLCVETSNSVTAHEAHN